MKSTRIVIADNDLLFRQGLVFDLGVSKTNKVVGCVSSGIELTDMLKQEKADVVIAYAYLPYLSGIEALKMIRHSHPGCKTLLYTNTYQEDVHRLMQHGEWANGYCGKDATVISTAVNTIFEKGRNYFDTEYYYTWKEKTYEYSDASSFIAFKELRPVDIKIIALSCEGKTNKEIAAELKLSARTIDTYSAAILEKLGFRSKLELVQFAFLNGICTKNCPNVTSGICVRKSIF